MPKCPTCKKEAPQMLKTWKFSKYDVNAYKCENCGTAFRTYYYKGENKFTLMRKGKERYHKPQ